MDEMKFYMFPKDPSQREVWKNVVNRPDYAIKKNSYMCMSHAKLIVISYSSVRLKYIAKVENQNLKTGQRTKLSKQILFDNQYNFHLL